LRERKAVLEAEIMTMEKTVPSADSMGSLKDEKKGLMDEIAALDKSLKQKDLEIKNTNTEIEKLRPQRDKLRERLSKLSSSEVSSGLEEFEKERQGLREQIIKNESSIQNMTSQLSMQAEEQQKINGIIIDSEKELKEFSEELERLEAELLGTRKMLKEKEFEQKKFYSNYQHMFTRKNKLNQLIQQQDIKVIKQEERVRGVEHRCNDISVRMALMAGEMEGMKKEFEEFKDVQLRRGVKLEELHVEIKSFEQSLRNMGNVNLRALEIYEKVNEEYKKLLDKYDKLKFEKEDVLKMMYEIESKKKAIFMKTFKVLAKNFAEIFASLSTKGDAILMLEDPEDPFAAGVDIEVKIAHNKSLDIKSLSGGEKTLAALSFIFAIQEFNPAPFYLMDEVDAALDKRNSELLSRLIAKYAKGAQYLIISHNDSIISEADTIYGVSMQEGITKVTSLRI
jgi:chromosome segregation protein